MNKIIWLILTLFLLSGCHTFRKLVPISETRQFEKLVEKAERNQPLYHTFKTKAKARVTTKDLDQNATLYLRVIHDTIIWGSVTYLFGIEVARFFITPDSAVLIDKFRQQYWLMPFDQMIQMLGMSGVNYHSLEAMITGGLIFPIDKRFERELQNDGFELTSRDNFSEVKIWLGFVDPVVKGYQVKTDANQYKARISYSGSIKSDGKTIPENVDIKVFNPGENTLNLNYQSISFDSEITINTTIPDEFRKIE